jgi:type IV pilus assembly protein PilA
MQKNLKRQKDSASARARRDGFTLIEILVVIGIIAVLALIVLVAINPARQFAQARNTQRTSNVEAILNAIGQNMADNKGMFVCTTGSGEQTISTSTVATIKSCSGSPCAGNEIDLSCLTPTYIPSLPFDPGKSGAGWTSSSTYDTEYTVTSNNGRITVAAPAASAETVISNPPPAISITR